MGDNTVFKLGKTIDPEGKWDLVQDKDNVKLVNKSDGSTCGHEVHVVKLQKYLSDFNQNKELCPICEFKSPKMGFSWSNWFDNEDEEESDARCDKNGPHFIESGNDLPFEVKWFIVNDDNIKTFERDHDLSGYIDYKEWTYGKSINYLFKTIGWEFDSERLEGTEFYYLQSRQGTKKLRVVDGQKTSTKPDVYAWAILTPFANFHEKMSSFREYEEYEKKKFADEEAFNRYFKIYNEITENYESYRQNTIYAFAINPDAVCTTEVSEDLLYGIAVTKVGRNVGYTTINTTPRVERLDDERIKAAFKTFGIFAGPGDYHSDCVSFSSIVVLYHQKYVLLNQ